MENKYLMVLVTLCYNMYIV